MEQTRKECKQRQLMFGGNNNWMSLLALIKKDKNDKKYFTPNTDYNLFKWNETHVTTGV